LLPYAQLQLGILAGQFGGEPRRLGVHQQIDRNGSHGYTY
jgi:hypothetical protein